MNSVKELEAHSLGPALTAYTEQTIHLGCIDGCKNHVNNLRPPCEANQVHHVQLTIGLPIY